MSSIGINERTINVPTGSFNVKYFKTYPYAISVYAHYASAFGDSGKTGIGNLPDDFYGTNASFFYDHPETHGADYGKTISLAVNKGFYVKPYGYNVASSWEKHPDCEAVMFCTNIPVNGRSVRIGEFDHFPYKSGVNVFWLRQIKWALGGHDLKIGSNYAGKAPFHAALSYGARELHGGAYLNLQRTFMGFDGAYVYLCAAFSPCNMYDEHLILKELGCKIGLNLDGGRSTQIRSPNGITTVEKYPGRPVPTFVKVTYAK